MRGWPSTRAAGSGSGGASCRRGTSSGTSSAAATSRPSCSGWPSRPTRRWTCPAPACWPTRSSSAGSSAGETDDGEQYLASTAVLSTIHVTHLRDMAPADAWPEEFHYGIDTYDLGVPGFGVYLATSAPPEFETPGGPVTAVSAGTVGWPEDVVQLGQDLRAGRFVSNVPWLLVATPTLVDPGRAPAGKHTVKVLSHQVYELPAGMPD